MKHCPSCNIEFNTSEKMCPLCQNILEGDTKDLAFASNTRYKTNSLILKILLFISIVVFLICAFIELNVSGNINWSMYVALGLLTNFVVIYFILKNYQNTFKMFAKYGLIIVLLLIMWYLYTKTSIITNYIIPIVCLLELLFNLFVGIILRKNYILKYTSQLLLNTFLCLVPLILVTLNLTTNNILSYICSLCSIITIVGMLIFFYDDIKDEITKFFNI